AYDNHPRMGLDHWVAPAPRSPIEVETADLMREDDARVILTGRMGDGLMGNSLSDRGSLSDLLAARRVRAFVSLAREWSRSSHEPLVVLLARALTGLVAPASDRAAWLATMLKQMGSRTVEHGFSLNAAFTAAHAASLGVTERRIGGYQPRQALLRDL